MSICYAHKTYSYRYSHNHNSHNSKAPHILFTCYLFEAPKILKMPAYTEPQTPNMHKLITCMRTHTFMTAPSYERENKTH